MKVRPDNSIRLEFSDGRPPMTDAIKINHAMADIDCGVWPLDLSSTPTDIRKLLQQPTLTSVEADQIKTHFLLPRQRLLEIILRVGREPHVPGGGELETFVINHGYAYPQLYLVEKGVDYSRFDRFHVNVADDGTAIDEVVQFISGGGFVIHHRHHNELILTLSLTCPSDDAGWIITYNGRNPHIGSLSGAELGSKMLVQAIGPARWVMRYEDDV